MTYMDSYVFKEMVLWIRESRSRSLEIVLAAAVIHVRDNCSLDLG